jgi:mono/diheme cytochrome c family protein
MKIWTVGITNGLLILGMAWFAAHGAGPLTALQKADAKTAPSKASSAAPLISSIQGPDLFRAYCASCHGADAKGGGPMTASLKVKPADLTRISLRNGGAFPRMRMERIISGEEQPAAGHGSSAMPVWGPIFSQVTTDVDLGRVRIDNLARYLADIQQK